MAIGNDNSNPTSYELEILTLVNNEGEGFDIRNIFMSCKIFESITSNFLMGEIIISDGINLLETAKLFGQESLRIKYSQNSGVGDETHPDDKIDKIFRIYKVDNIKKASADLTAYKLSFCSQELIQAKRQRVNQAFRGSLTDIAASVAEQYLDIKNEQNEDSSGLTPKFDIRLKSEGDNFHVVIPNYKVDDTINYLCSKSQGTANESGLQNSFFFFETANGSYRIQTLESMMESRYAGGRPFVYTNVQDKDTKIIPADKTEADEVGISRRILSYSIGTSANVLKATVNGMFASKQFTIDNTYKFFSERSYNFLEKFYGDELGSIEEHPFVRIQPETIYIGKDSGEGEDVEIIGNSEYDTIGSYADSNLLIKSDSQFVHHEQNTIVQPGNNAAAGADQFRQAARELLEYHTVEVVISARTDISCGALINLQVPISSAGADNLDPAFYSGDHLITDIMWKLTPSDCKVNVRAIKDSVINNIETTEIEYGATLSE
tara:strand:- start:520 stop:1995 length:1476 start_codon:yes stop_codon:yes gene_type:complete